MKILWVLNKESTSNVQFTAIIFKYKLFTKMPKPRGCKTK